MTNETEFDAAETVAYGRQVVQAELNAIRDMLPLIDERFGQAVQRVLDCKGRLVVTGVGKSGLIGQKISATLASTGTPSLFLHSGEAVHGDMGRVLPEDVVLALSYSGSTEVMRLVPIIKKLGAGLVSITSTPETPLGMASDVCLPVGKIEEACPIGMAPTSSTTAMLALGDALAMTVAHQKHFTREEFALFHSGGALGRALVTVGEVMRTLEIVPDVVPGTPVREAIAHREMTAHERSGAVIVTGKGGRLIGIFTDGDLRRTLLVDPQLLDRPIEDVMTKNPKVAKRSELLADTFRRMKEHKIDEIPVVGDDGVAIGMLDVQDLVEWGIAS
jgi:arabinose-5-phosphate isomerase